MLAKERLTDGVLEEVERNELADQCLADFEWFADQFDELQRLFGPTMRLTG